jgi:hypothetical protein
MGHDGQQNNCPSSGFVMNAILGVIPTQFSDCSPDEADAFLSGTFFRSVDCLANRHACAARPSPHAPIAMHGLH